MHSNPWQFWIDRGGTFTDIVARSPDGKIQVHKLLSENPDRYEDAPVQGIREILGLGPTEAIPPEQLGVVKMGTTVATNALLERKGDRTVWVTTAGFGDGLRIGYQHRPELFALEIKKPPVLYGQVIEVAERHSAQGEVLTPLEQESLQNQLQTAYDQGFRSCAIAFLHGYRYPRHEQRAGEIARAIGFTQISLSHQVSPLMKWVSRAETTVVDAYLSPILRRYVDQVQGQLGPKIHLMFMQSNGGLVAGAQFQGKDSILSGPAGGIVGAVKTCGQAGYDKIITFDMGGTSTDVAHYNGHYERSLETEIAGVRLRSPMMDIHTVAAGGGSILHYDGDRYRVGPDSAGANPGPASYGNGGPLTVTDCNVMVGKLQPEFFPAVFGAQGNEPLDRVTVQRQFHHLTTTIQDGRSPEAVATGFLAIAVENMAQAIKKISLERGYDVADYTLCCFGGAGGQHACLLAQQLGMTRILLHPYAGVLSAYGIGLADVGILKEKAMEKPLGTPLFPELNHTFSQLETQALQELRQQPTTDLEEPQIQRRLLLKYAGTDATLEVNFGEEGAMVAQFETQHRQRYGFVLPQKTLVVESVVLELIAPTAPLPSEPAELGTPSPGEPVARKPVYFGDRWYDTPIYHRQDLCRGQVIPSPALIIEPTGTNVLEPGWQGEIIGPEKNLLLTQRARLAAGYQTSLELGESKADPVYLEIFNNRFRAIAEQMGTTLQNTSYSVNIKERLDFSCALFDGAGNLVANAPHIPVHLGSMGESVQSLLRDRRKTLAPGDVYLLNNPYNGGTHLPDLTVITPIFWENQEKPQFFVASRGHHADLGGITPGSMPPHSTHIAEEGILIDHFPLVKNGQFQETALLERLTHGPYPVRNPTQNLADLQAQIAANEKGVQELTQLLKTYGLPTVQAYMGHIQDQGEQAVRRAIAQLKNGSFTVPLDQGGQIQVHITVNPQTQEAAIDFSGTSLLLANNFNTPRAVVQAVVLYCFRCLVPDNIPLNQGCLRPLTLTIPEGCFLNPQAPAAVVAGNVETSQNLADGIFGALGILAASQGTMNNLTFGSDRHQYYETIGGGAGAGAHFPGADAVQTHMTNSRLTDPEVLEWRFPVRVDRFAIRAGSGGAGTHRGGNGIIRQLTFLEPMAASILSSRRVVAPFGLRGGEAGQRGKNWVKKGDRPPMALQGTDAIALEAGDSLIIETPGGGGYGPPIP